MTEEQTNQRKELEDQAKWYVIHTYSGHENKVKFNLESMVKNNELYDIIFDVRVPMEEYVETKDGVDKTKERKLFPSYVLVKMIMNDRSWYLVRNTRGVTGFVGPGSKPVPLSDEEVLSLGVASEKVANQYEVGDQVKVIKGPLSGYVGTVIELTDDKEKIKVNISMFGRDTKVELDHSQIEAF